ncbi:MAG TPA: glycosyltransferase [Thermoleophilia bacterium]|nr:glycosyltransferase [Thermoleophilia bacterium]
MIGFRTVLARTKRLLTAGGGRSEGGPPYGADWGHEEAVILPPIEVPASTPEPAQAVCASSPVTTPQGGRPRVLILAGKPGWAHDAAALPISRHLGDEFEFHIDYVSQRPDLSGWQADLIYVLFWGEDYHRKYVKDPTRVVKQISSHRWATDRYGNLTAAQLARKHLVDAATLSVPSKRLQSMIAPYRDVMLAQKGFEPADFVARGRHTGKLRIGWAGDPNDRCKGLKEVLHPAAGDDFELLITSGSLDRRQMVDFYNSIDVICVASTAEGDPLPLIEGMACGCFPVCVDVGIVPELVRHRENGLIARRSPTAFRAAFDWCAGNLDFVRGAGLRNAEDMLRTRTWEVVSLQWREVLRHAYRNVRG